MGSSLSSAAIGYLHQQKFRFACTGFFHICIQVAEAHSQTSLGNVTLNRWRSGAIFLPTSGKLYPLNSSTLWNNEWIWLDTPQELIRYQNKMAFFKQAGIITCTTYETSPLLLLLGLYLGKQYLRLAAETNT
jgi:hypothetical protein